MTSGSGVGAEIGRDPPPPHPASANAAAAAEPCKASFAALMFPFAVATIVSPVKLFKTLAFHCVRSDR